MKRVRAGKTKRSITDAIRRLVQDGRARAEGPRGRQHYFRVTK